MTLKDGSIIWLFLMIIGQSAGVSYNQPKFCPNASWNPNATTFAGSGVVGSHPYDIFINTNNTIYVASQSNNGQIIVWLNGSTTPISNISVRTSYFYSIFAITSEDIYAESYYSIGGVSKWSISSITGIPAMYTCGSCFDLFIDIANTLYCSLGNSHQIITKSLNIPSNTLKVVAGTGSPGPTSNMLWDPRGIFVDINFDLYVCDSGNNRIQLFRSGESNGTTIAGGSLAINAVILTNPTAIILDADKNLYISDYGNHRIVGGSIATGFRCLVGCSNPFGSSASQLEFPWSISFDSYGNLFVTDQYNSRIQKFMLLTNLCEGTMDDNTTSNETITSTLSSAEDLFSTTTTEEANNATIDPLNSTFIAVSYNQPTFDAFASWSANAITFANSSTVGSQPYSIFVNSNNTIYVANKASGRILIWLNNNTIPTKIISGNLLNPYSIFVTINGDIYIDNSYSNNHIEKRTLNSNTSVLEMNVNQKCYGLFVAINNVLYCSMSFSHQVITKSLNDNSSVLTMVAGLGCAGSTSNMLWYPRGIFVDTNFDLYVADCYNNRIQLFRTGQLTGITVVGNATTTLQYPSGIILDGDKNLFIADSGNNRIVRSGSTGFQCIVGCTGIYGSASNQLNNPWSLSFDSYGNIFVTDSNNNRVQKFTILNYNLDLSYNQPKLCSSTTWNSVPITLATNSPQQFYSIFVNANDTAYAIDQVNNQILIWSNDDIYPIGVSVGNFSNAYSIFVTNNDEIYIDNGTLNGRVDKWSLKTMTSIPVMNVSSACYGLFVDISNTLYCSMSDLHQVVKRSLDDNMMTLTTVAGVAYTSGSASNLLYNPCGIFLDTNYDLYVADSGNDRIQLFQSGNLTAITVAGAGSLTITIALNNPTGIILDADKYLYITDSANQRIVGSGPTGFRCILGCYNINSGSNPFGQPWSLSFDSYGNLFVTDVLNNQIQKFSLATNSCVLSYNKPKFCSNVTWNPNATTWTSGSSTIGLSPYGIFINGINTIYVAGQTKNSIFIWPEGMNSVQRITGTFNSSKSIFVSIRNDIYLDNGNLKHRVDKWSYNLTYSGNVMNVSQSCYGLFIDLNNTLYCSLAIYNQVIKLSLDDPMGMKTIAAGNGSSGSESHMLSSPRGIYVNLYFNLYVADCGNNRIQLFSAGQLIGTTLTQNVSLNCPTGIVLDADDYLFIVDSNNHRIIEVRPNAFRCLMGCSGVAGSLPNQLNFPQSMAFDSYGNIFVSDRSNNRIQVFNLATNSCEEFTTVQPVLISTTTTPITTTTSMPTTTTIATPITTSTISLYQQVTNSTNKTTSIQETTIPIEENTSTQETELVQETPVVQETTVSIEETTPIQETTVPFEETMPVQETTIPIEETTPIQETTVAFEETTILFEEITVSIEETTLAFEETTSTRETELVQETTAFIQETPATQEITVPIEEITLIQETTVPFEETTVPIEETTLVQETTVLIEETTPIQQITVPFEETTIPIEETTPVQEITVPFEETTVPIEETTPVQEITVPFEDTTVPIEETTLIQEITVPFEETTVPIEETTPIQQITVPFEETTLVQETEPVQETTTTTTQGLISIHETTSIEELLFTGVVTFTEKIARIQETTMPTQEITTIEETTSNQETVLIEETTSNQGTVLIEETTSVQEITTAQGTIMSILEVSSNKETTSGQETITVQGTTVLTQEATSIHHTITTTTTSTTTTSTTTSRTTTTTSTSTSSRTTTTSTSSRTTTTSTSSRTTSTSTTTTSTTPIETTAIEKSKSTEEVTLNREALSTSKETLTTDNMGHSSASGGAALLQFVAPTCFGQNTIGTNCNTSSLPCDILKPCQNNGTCTNDNTTANGYICTCPPYFDGDQCRSDNRPCTPTTCWNNGICNETSNTTFVCSCSDGWAGIHCETMVNYCKGVKCENNGVCRPLFLNYTCECLGASYSGRHCEYVSTSRVIRRAVSKSFGYVVIIFLLVVAGFFVIMDILKYFFGIDPAKHELEKIRRTNAMKRIKRQRQLVAQRFIYVPAPTERAPRTETLNNMETGV